MEEIIKNLYLFHNYLLLNADINVIVHMNVIACFISFTQYNVVVPS